MKSLPLLALAATAALLPACSKTGDTSSAAGNETAAANGSAPAGPVQLPPMVAKTTSYRCADSSVVTVDFFADNLSANLKTADATLPVKLTAPEAGKPFVADGGYSLSGDGSTVEIALPGKKAQSCNG